MANYSRLVVGSPEPVDQIITTLAPDEVEEGASTMTTIEGWNHLVPITDPLAEIPSAAVAYIPLEHLPLFESVLSTLPRNPARAS